MNRNWVAFVVGAGVILVGGTALAQDGVTAAMAFYSLEHGWKGYIEDRRPASNADPYRVTSRILKTYSEAHENAIG